MIDNELESFDNIDHWKTTIGNKKNIITVLICYIRKTYCIYHNDVLNSIHNLDCVDMIYEYDTYFKLTSLHSYFLKMNEEIEIKSQTYLVKSPKKFINLSNDLLERHINESAPLTSDVEIMIYLGSME